MTNKNFQTHAEYTNYHENRGREIFQKYFNNSDYWSGSTITYTDNQYSNFDGIITMPNNAKVLLEIKCREKPEREKGNDIWIPQNKIDWLIDNFKDYDCFDFFIGIIEPKNELMYVITKKSVQKYYNDQKSWSVQKNFPDPTYTVEKVYSYYKKDLTKITLNNI